MSDRLSPRRKVLFYTIMIGLTFALSFTLLEYGLATYYQSTETHVASVVFDPVLGWRLRPGVYWIKPLNAFREHEVYINEYGLRADHIVRAATNDVKRIVILGDSFTFATQIPTESTFPVLIENRLNQSRPFEIVNAGVPGYGTAQELLFMKELARKNVVGDVYLLMIFINDIMDNLRLDYGTGLGTPAQPGFSLGQDGRLALTHSPRKEYSTHFIAPQRARPGLLTAEVVRNRISIFLQTRPNLVNLLNRVGFRPEISRMPSLINGWYEDEVLVQGIPLTKALIEAIKKEAERNHAVLLASLIPSPIQVYPRVYDPILKRTFGDNKSINSYFNDPTRPQRMIAAMCEELKIPFLDLYPILRRHDDKELFIPVDGHFDRDGHALVAQHLSSFILENGRTGSPRSEPVVVQGQR